VGVSVASSGVPVEKALRMEWTFMRAAGAIDRDTPDEATLTPTGRYLLVVMMREMLSGSNELRDEARAALSPEERMLLLDGVEPTPALEAGLQLV
jgi:hypothetical protein